ncbi:MAG: LytTR family transcriptional regulator [Bacteroidales bacterium]|nr:LytTR family transcriptional regulator [Candidatus Sodaliphilus limicaballi]
MEWLQITTTTALYRFRTDEIVCVQADGNYSDVYTCTGKPRKLTFKLHQFDEWFATLQQNTFVRVGRSFIVNKLFIQAINITDSRIVLAGGKMSEPMIYGGFSKDSLKALKAALEKGGQL